MDSFIQHYSNLYKELATALEQINYSAHASGFEFTQYSYQHPERNFFFTMETDIPDTVIQEKRPVIVSEHTPQKLIKQGYQLKEQYTLFLRSPQKMTVYPPADNVEIRSFSFNARNRGSYRILDMLDMLPIYLNIPADDIKEFERVPRALLHIYSDAKLYIVENRDQEILSLAITVSETDENITSIHYLVTPQQLRKQGYATLLLRHIINANRNKTILLLGPEQEYSSQFVAQLQFKKIHSWNMWQ